MAIAINPSRKKPTEASVDDFIAAPARRQEPGGGARLEKAKPRRNVTLAFDAGIYERVGQAAERLGMSRNAFFSTAAVEKMERMGI